RSGRRSRSCWRRDVRGKGFGGSSQCWNCGSGYGWCRSRRWLDISSTTIEKEREDEREGETQRVRDKFLHQRRTEGTTGGIGAPAGADAGGCDPAGAADGGADSARDVGGGRPAGGGLGESHRRR